MSTDQNTLIKHSTIYAVADISRKLISFIMLPIYTRFLTPEDYGAVELLSMVITIAEILLGARLGHAIFRFYYKYDAPLQKKQVLSTALIITLFASVFALFILILSANKLSMFVFNTYELQGILSLFALRVVLIPIEEYAFLLLRIHKKVWHFFTFSIIKTILQLSLNIYFVVVLNKGVEGVVLSSLYSGAIMSIPALFYLFRTTGMNFNVEIAKKLILFSAPLWGSAILGFYLGLSDRFFIQKMIDLNEVGIYALSVKLAMILMILVWWPFEKAWEGVRYEIYNSPEGSKLQFMNVFSTINLVSILVGLGICLFSREVITLMASDGFSTAYLYVGPLILGQIFRQWTSYLQFAFLVTEKTKLILYGQIVSALALTVGFLILIPLLGTLGAALSFTLGAGVELLWTVVLHSKYYDMGVRFKSSITILLIAISAYLFSLLFPGELLISIPAKMTTLLVVTAAIYSSPLLSDHQKQLISTRVSYMLKLTKKSR